MKHSVLPLSALLLVAAAGSAQDDSDRARAAVERGEFLRLGVLLPRIETEFGGRVIELELEVEDGRDVYEFEILTEDGRLFEVDVDAATGEVIEVEEEID